MTIIGTSTIQTPEGIARSIESQLEKADIVRLTRSQAYVLLELLKPQTEAIDA